MMATYNCKYAECSYVTPYHSNLKKHVNFIHTKEKKYLCSQEGCSFKSAANGNLKSHIRFIHASASKGNLTKHVNSQHTKTGIQNKKKKEHHLFKYLQDQDIIKEATLFDREHCISFRCVKANETWCYVDFIIIINGLIVLLENDETQHDTYAVSCESSRAVRIHETLALEGNTLPILFIRFNPDAYRVDGKLKKISRIDRYAKLMQVIKEYSDQIEKAPLHVVYMYYDVKGTNGKLCIADDSEFSLPQTPTVYF